MTSFYNFQFSQITKCEGAKNVGKGQVWEHEEKLRILDRHL